MLGDGTTTAVTAENCVSAGAGVVVVVVVDVASAHCTALDDAGREKPDSHALAHSGTHTRTQTGLVCLCVCVCLCFLCLCVCGVLFSIVSVCVALRLGRRGSSSL